MAEPEDAGGARAFPDRPEIVGDYGTGESNPAEDAHGRAAEDEDRRAIDTAIRNIADAYWYWDEIWSRCHEDLEFCYVKQWDDQDIKERAEGSRPALTINHLPTLVSNVVGAARQSNFAVKVKRKAGLNEHVRSSRGARYSNAEVIAGIIRDVESRSEAREQYMQVLQHATESGIGWLKLVKHRPVDDPLNVELRIRRLQNRFSVIFDPYATATDRSDARWCSETIVMSRREFEERHGEPADRHAGAPDLSGGGADVGPGFNVWWQGTDRDEVRIVEYWWKKPMPNRELVRIANPEALAIASVWEDEAGPVLDELKDAGWREVARHKIDSWVVMGMQFTRAKMLQKPIRWEGNALPLFQVAGRTIDFDGKTHYASLHRYAKDSQRMENFWASAATERVAQAPKDEYVVADRQLEGHDGEFDTGGPPRGKRVYKHVEGLQAPRREAGPQLPTAEITLMAVGRDTIKETTGLYQANLGAEGNEVSGRAIQARQMGGQTSTYEFVDNLASAIARVGQAIAEMAPKIMGRSALTRIVGEDGTDAEVMLNQTVEDEETGMSHIVGALDLARYEVTCSVGPAYATQREEFVAHLTELGKNNPEAITPVLDLYIRAMDLPFAGEMARRFKWLIPRHMLSEEDRAEMPEPEMTPDQKVEALKAEAQIAAAQATRAKAESDQAIAGMRIDENQARVDQQLVRLEQEKVQLEQEVVQLQQEMQKVSNLVEKAELDRESAANAAETERAAKVAAARSIDAAALP